MTRPWTSTPPLSLVPLVFLATTVSALAAPAALSAPGSPATGGAPVGGRSAQPAQPAPPAGTGRAAGPSVGGRSGTTVVEPTRVPLPPARPVATILADFVTALGGKAALNRHHSLHTSMEITFKGLGITGTAEHYGAAGDRALTITEIPKLASTREGSDGTRFWSEDPINGLRVLDGVEAEQARIESAWNAELRMTELFEKMEARNERAEDGGPLECLTLVPKVGAGMTNCFDARTHLLVTQKGVRSGPQGDMPFTARLSDWRTVVDVKIAFATDMQVGPLAFSGRLISAELDIPVDHGMFAVPSVKAAGRARPGSGTSGSGAASGARGKRVK